MKLNLTARSTVHEFIDSQHYTIQDYKKNLWELDTFNKITGSIRFTLIQLAHAIDNPSKEYHLVDLGCGGGAFLHSVANWSRKTNIRIKLSGVDYNPLAIEYLNEHVNGNGIKGYTADYKTFLENYPDTIDFIHCSLFCHHLTDTDLTDLIQFALQKNATLIINDLVRSRLAYYGARILTYAFNGTELAKNDGPLSVLKGFTKDELLALIRSAGAYNYRIYFIPLFRFVAVIKPNNNATD